MNPLGRTSWLPMIGVTPLLNGLSWRGFGLVALLFGIWSLQWTIEPTRLVSIGGGDAVLKAWVALWVAMLVGGMTLFVSIVVFLNLAVRAGFTSAWIVLPAAFAGSLAAAMVSALVGSAPTGLATASGHAPGAAFWADWAMAIAVGYLVLQRIDAARDGMHQLELQRKSLEIRQMEARLNLLGAQIEPHFLFNTLSNIRRLCQQNLAGGRAMLAQLSHYLHAALPKIRRDHAALAEEIELALAYLELQKIRMGERLKVSVDVPADHLSALVPSMMLVTLVENAIKHGIAPLPEGGSIRISTLRDKDLLTLTVTDTGRGFVAESGSGVGLANLRARLSALHGERAWLRLEGNLPRGVLASIVLPWTEKDDAG